MNTKIKMISTIVTVIMMIFMLATMSMAFDPAGIAATLTGTGTQAQGNITSIGNQLIGIITTVGVVVAVIVLLVLGIKYMMGSAQEKAEYKKTMIPYLIGAVLIFGASAITKVIISIGTNIKVS